MKQLKKKVIAQKSTEHRKFTLVEILMVIVIMALLMTAAMPAFIDMMKGQGVEASARNICQMLKLARAHAINNREYVALLMPRDNMDDKYLFRSYRVCLVTKTGSDSDSTFKFKRWLPGEEWTFVSTGVAILQIDKAPGGVNITNNIPDDDSDAYSTISDVPDSSGDLRGIVFAKNGTTDSGTTPYYVSIGQGVYTSGVIANYNADSVVNISINGFTGKVTFEND